MPTMPVLHGELSHNTRIAAALLEVLADSGEVARRARALRAIGAGGGDLRRSDGWIPPAEFAAMLRAAGLDRRLARRVGQRLVRPDAVGLALCYGGLATPEKTYRRAHQLLARECRSGRYEPREIDAQSGRILYHPPARGSQERLADEIGEAFCGLRQGMLEAVPLLFGLLPAQVRESECAFQGGERCVFQLKWTRQLRRGLWAGCAVGAGLGAGLGLAAVSLGLPLGVALVVGAGVAALAAAAGRGVDLARQLEAVAGARRGQLALLDQLDASLAERMDELAKTGASGDLLLGGGTREGLPPEGSEAGLVPVARVREKAGEGAAAPALAGAQQTSGELRAAAAALREGLEALRARLDAGEAGDADGARLLQDCHGHGRRIEALAVLLEGRLRSAGAAPAALDLGALAARSLASLQGQRPDAPAPQLHVAESLPPVRGDAFQLGYALEQLVRGASEAAGAASAVCVDLDPSPAGVEMVVRWDAGGLDPDTVEQALDPFSAAASPDAEAAFGLQLAYRIVEEHGGELHVQSAEESGTRVRIVLPAAPPAEA